MGCIGDIFQTTVLDFEVKQRDLYITKIKYNIF